MSVSNCMFVISIVLKRFANLLGWQCYQLQTIELSDSDVV